MHVTDETAVTSHRSSPLAWTVLVAALLQVAAPLVTLNGPGASPSEGSGPDLLITPAGWAFSIWSLIYVLTIGQAIAVLMVRSAGVSPYLQVTQAALYVGAAIWIMVAGLDSSGVAAVVLVLMLVAAVVALDSVVRTTVVPGWLRLLTRTTVGLYAGWVTAAAFLNVSTALAEREVLEANALGWQLVVLVLAAATLIVVTLASGGVLGYALAGLWALLGIAVTGREDGNGEVVAVAAVAALVLAGAALAAAVRSRRSTAPDAI